MSSTDNQQRPEIPFAGVVYGDIVYWGTIVAAVVAMVGSMVSFMSGSNYMDPAYLLSAIWQGDSYDVIWRHAVGSPPDGHWYLRELATGNGLTMAGLAFGVFIVIPAIIASGLVLLKERKVTFGIMALIAAAITIVAMSGMLNFIFEMQK